MTKDASEKMYFRSSSTEMLTVLCVVTLLW